MFTSNRIPLRILHRPWPRFAVCLLLGPFLAILPLAGCAPQRHDGAPPLATSVHLMRTELYFGLNRSDGGQVSAEEFTAFLDREITGRFPSGLTCLSGDGRSLNPKGVVVAEPCRVVILLYAPADASEAQRKIARICNLYITGFHQDSVLRADSTVNVQFIAPEPK